MRFKDAVLKTPALARAYQPGLQALKASDVDHITCEKPRALAGSVDVDKALSDTLHNMPRWDYAVGIKYDRRTDEVIWIEVHPASSTSEVDRVLAKLTWLKEWAAEAAPHLIRLPGRYVWVATGRVAFSPNSPQRRRLAQAGIQFPGSRYNMKLAMKSSKQS